MFSTFSDVLQEAAKSPSVKGLSDAAKAASEHYRKKPSAARAKAASEAHSAAYHAHKAKGDNMSNLMYNRMSEHGKFADHYANLARSHERDAAK